MLTFHLKYRWSIVAKMIQVLFCLNSENGILVFKFYVWFKMLILPNWRSEILLKFTKKWNASFKLELDSNRQKDRHSLYLYIWWSNGQSRSKHPQILPPGEMYTFLKKRYLKQATWGRCRITVLGNWPLVKSPRWLAHRITWHFLNCGISV